MEGAQIVNESWCIVRMTTERRGSENGAIMLRREERMTLMAFGLGASFTKNMN